MFGEAAAVVHLAIATTVAAPLLYAAAAKVLDPSAFVRAQPHLRLPLPQRQWTAWIVAVLELASGMAVLISLAWTAALVVVVLYLLFALLLARARRLGADGDCGCFGALPSRIGVAAVARNVALAAIAVLLSGLRLDHSLAPYPPQVGITSAILLFIGSAVVDTAIMVRGNLRR